MESTYGYLPFCFPWIDDRRNQKPVTILVICSGILSWKTIFWQLFKYLENVWIRMFYKKLNQKSPY